VFTQIIGSGILLDPCCWFVLSAGADESAFPAGVSKACPIRTLSDLYFVGTAGEGRRCAAGVSKACPIRTLSDMHFVGTAGEGRRCTLALWRLRTLSVSVPLVKTAADDVELSFYRVSMS
jgi:hypothetical protein